MKSTFILAFIFVLLELCYSASVEREATVDPTKVEDNIIQQLLDFLPLEQAKQISEKHLKEDPSFQAAIRYLNGPEWKEIVENLRNAPKWQAYKEYLKSGGIDLNPVIEHVRHCLNAANVPEVAAEVKPSLANYATDLQAELLVPIARKLNNHSLADPLGSVQIALKKLSDDESKRLFQDAMLTPELRRALGKIHDLGINVDQLMGMVFSILNWPPKTLKEFEQLNGS